MVCKIHNYSKGLSLFFPKPVFCWESKPWQQKCQHLILGKGHNRLYLCFGSLHVYLDQNCSWGSSSEEHLPAIFSGTTHQDRKELNGLWMFLRTHIRNTLQWRVFPKAKETRGNTTYCLKSQNNLIVQIPINLTQQLASCNHYHGVTLQKMYIAALV